MMIPDLQAVDKQNESVVRGFKLVVPTNQRANCLNHPMLAVEMITPIPFNVWSYTETDLSKTYCVTAGETATLMCFAREWQSGNCARLLTGDL